MWLLSDRTSRKSIFFFRKMVYLIWCSVIKNLHDKFTMTKLLFTNLIVHYYINTLFFHFQVQLQVSSFCSWFRIQLLRRSIYTILMNSVHWVIVLSRYLKTCCIVFITSSYPEWRLKKLLNEHLQQTVVMYIINKLIWRDNWIGRDDWKWFEVFGVSFLWMNEYWWLNTDEWI